MRFKGGSCGSKVGHAVQRHQSNSVAGCFPFYTTERVNKELMLMSCQNHKAVSWEHGHALH
jgi:hypothetical protein